MRLVRSVAAGVVLGAIGGYAAALLRPRPVYRSARPDLPGLDFAPLPERYDAGETTDLDAVGIDAAEVRG